jgi:hypothetical protein
MKQKYISLLQGALSESYLYVKKSLSREALVAGAVYQVAH